MKKKQLLHFLLNQYFISAIIAIAVIIFLPKYFNKFKINLIKTELLSNENDLYYQDLDGDGFDEKIQSQTNTIGNSSYMIQMANGDFFDQFNYFKPFATQTKTIWFQDIDDNGFMEIFHITKSNDSLFLNIKEPLKPDGISRQSIFIDTIARYNNEYNVVNAGVGENGKILRDHDNDIIFGIKTGYNSYPRHVYKYLFDKDKFLKSSHLTNPPSIRAIMDIDNDGKSEVLVATTSPQNDNVALFSNKSDYSVWLTILDDNMDFYFDQVEFKSLGSIDLTAFRIEDSVMLVGHFRTREPTTIPSKIFEISHQGKILKEKEIERSTHDFSLSEKQNSLVISNMKTGKLYELDFNFNITKSHNINLFSRQKYLDVNGDGLHEWIEILPDNNTIIISDTNFKNQLFFDLEVKGDEKIKVFNPINYKGQTELVLKKGSHYNTYLYSKNEFYNIRFLFYLVVYVVVLGIVWLILKGQKLRLEKKLCIQKQISELQIKAVKNQVDPHFVFNAINTISEMTLMDNKLEADTFITKFSKFMRDTLSNSDKISTTLSEELEYTENFIKLQQVRYNQSFEYDIKLSDNLKKQVLVPKHVLFCYVENAIKHGLALKENGHLEIGALMQGEILILYVQDNGGGFRKSDQPKKSSTGNGLLIMERIFELYEKLHKRKIKHYMSEIKDKKGKHIGVRIDIEVIIPKKKKDAK